MCNLPLFLSLAVRGKASANLETVSFLGGLYSSNPQPNDSTFAPLNTPDPQAAEQFSGHFLCTQWPVEKKNQL